MHFIHFCSFPIQVLVFTKQSYGKVILVYKCLPRKNYVLPCNHQFLGEQGGGRMEIIIIIMVLL